MTTNKTYHKYIICDPVDRGLFSLFGKRGRRSTDDQVKEDISRNEETNFLPSVPLSLCPFALCPFEKTGASRGSTRYLQVVVLLNSNRHKSFRKIPSVVEVIERIRA